MITQTKNFDTIVEFMDHLKSKSEVVGILEYGNRTYDNMIKGGDYDLTVVTNTPVSEKINGLHFHIGGIPVDF